MFKLNSDSKEWLQKKAKTLHNLSYSAFGCLKLSLIAWNIILCSFLIDLFLISVFPKFIAASLSAQYLSAASIFLIISAIVLSSQDHVRRLLSGLRKVRLYFSSDKNKFAPWILAGLIAFIFAIEMILRIQSISKGSMIGVVFCLVISIPIFLKLAKDKKEYDLTLSENRELYLVLINRQNLLFTIAPMVLLRSAALMAALQIQTSEDHLLALIHYSIALLTFLSTQPRKEQFTQRCRHCARYKIFERSDLQACETCRVEALQKQHGVKHYWNSQIEKEENSVFKKLSLVFRTSKPKEE